MSHQAKKRFGQNFLVNEQVIADIIRAIRPEADDNMVEIGPGLGALTRPLLKQLNTLSWLSHPTLVLSVETFFVSY